MTPNVKPEQECHLLRRMPQDLVGFGADGGHGPALQLSEPAGIRGGVGVLGMCRHISVSSKWAHLDDLDL